ncbi:MAG TPA: hypothetical protein VFL63_13555, partial [Rhodanobacteraceae bacterium]|nr:hypothetical protein [Rhodanobacteraceae bacterium]
MPSASSLNLTRQHLATRSALLAMFAIAFVLATAWLDGGAGIVPPALWNHPGWVPWWSTPLRMLCNALPG